jgi:hypothetical protein
MGASYQTVRAVRARHRRDVGARGDGASYGAGALLAMAARVPSALRRLIGAVLVANALDLSTSLLPTFIDGNPSTRRSPTLMAIQLALVVPLAALAGAGLPRLSRWWRALPIPLVPRTLMSSFLLLQLVHVALRMEIYPFTNVAIFGDVVGLPIDPALATVTYEPGDGRIRSIVMAP